MKKEHFTEAKLVEHFGLKVSQSGSGPISICFRNQSKFPEEMELKLDYKDTGEEVACLVKDLKLGEEMLIEMQTEETKLFAIYKIIANPIIDNEHILIFSFIREVTDTEKDSYKGIFILKIS